MFPYNIDMVILLIKSFGLTHSLVACVCGTLTFTFTPYFFLPIFIICDC